MVLQVIWHHGVTGYIWYHGATGYMTSWCTGYMTSYCYNRHHWQIGTCRSLFSKAHFYVGVQCWHSSFDGSDEQVSITVASSRPFLALRILCVLPALPLCFELLLFWMWLWGFSFIILAASSLLPLLFLERINGQWFRDSIHLKIQFFFPTPRFSSLTFTSSTYQLSMGSLFSLSSLKSVEHLAY